jgi:hypothetical protein
MFTAIVLLAAVGLRIWAETEYRKVLAKQSPEEQWRWRQVRTSPHL